MVERFTQGKLTWVDVLNPTTDELRELIETFRINPDLLTDASSRGSQPVVLTAGDMMKLVLHFPIVKRKDITQPHELELIVTKKALISIRYEDIEAVDRFKKEFEVVTLLYKAKRTATGGHILYSLLSVMYASLNLKLDYLESQMPDIEAGIDGGKEKEMVSLVSELTRKVMAFRHIVRVHDRLLREAREQTETCFGADVSREMNELYEQLGGILRRANNLFEVIEGLRNTNMALLTIKQNEITKLFTIMAFVTFPLSLFSSLFGMNTSAAPIVGNPGDFWIIVGIMSIATICFFAFFKYKHWM